MKNNKGFVVSAVLYPLLVLFLALIMGLLAMTDTRKRILDKMKLEISDSIFDEATCSCDTILNKLNYIIKNGVAGGGGGGSYTYNVLGVNVKAYDAPASMPNVGNGIGDIAVITDVEIDNYYVSRTAPGSPKEGTVWIVQDKTSNYHITSDYSNIGISYVMQYINGKWELKKSYVYDNARWTLLYYVPLKDGIVDLTGTDINADIVKTYSYTGNYQIYTARFSGYYQVELWGAQGGTNNASYPGGLGAYTSGEIYLDAGEQLYVYVGGEGKVLTGGWNGGGEGFAGREGSAGGGGGATDIRLVNTSEKNIWNEFDSLKSRIMVAAGGGGGSWYASSFIGSGGAGGGLNGYSGIIKNGTAAPGTGASETYGGNAFYDTNSVSPTLGGFGYGGQSYHVTWSSAGGGSGYYGGGGGAYAGGPGGGGSSYISGHEGCNSIMEASTLNNLVFSGKSVHFTKYYFRNTQMIDGTGYGWNAAKGNLSNMPTHDGASKMAGNSGNGYAKITLKEIKYLDNQEKMTLEEEKEKIWNFTYTNNHQIFRPIKSGTYKVELWGAQGGANHASYPGGLGSYTSGEIYLNAGDQLYLYVGGKSVFLDGGYNGGGSGFKAGEGSAGGGGGSTDIRLTGGEWSNFDSLKSRIMVAAGGGGGSWYASSFIGTGGAGGGLNGYSGIIKNGTGSPGVGGGSNVYGNSRSNVEAITKTVSSFGYGGDAYTSHSAAGGGSGYYGGGGGSYAGASGGGGSSYISGHNGCNSVDEESTSSNIIHIGTPYHYSGYYFTKTSMIDGDGYRWSSYRQTKTNMPVVNESKNMTGKSGNGHAKITLIREETKSSNSIADTKKKSENFWSYEFNHNVQQFVANKEGNYKIELWGAEGTTNNASYPGGLGAYSSGEIYLSAGTKLYVFVGNREIAPIYLQGGWNGGGEAFSGGGGSAGGGGGATDIRTITTSKINIWNEIPSLKSRIMVASGGGGGSWYATSFIGTGGAGGGLNGYTGIQKVGTGSPGTGGTQIKAGFSSYNASAKELTAGNFGYGGQSYHVSWSSAGGGSGWYGGGGGSYAGASGGGGSSYISGHAGCIAVNSNGTPKTQTYTTLNDSISYTGHKFTNTSMIDGQGYSWTTSKSSSISSMPTKDGTGLMVGNSGDGYAKIMYLGA